MSAAQRITLTIDADKVTPQTTPKNDLYQGDKNANEIEIELVRGGVPVALSGYTAAGSMERSDGNQVPCSGRIEGSKIIITLNEHCYVYAGPYTLDIELSGGGEELRRTIAQITGTVKKTASGSIVEVEEEIVDIDAVTALYGEMKTIKNEAEEAATRANSAANSANSAANSANSAASNVNTAVTNANAATTAANNAADYIKSATVSAEKLPPGSTPTATKSEVDGHLHLTFGLVTGDKGDKGDQGKPYTIIGDAYATPEQLAAAITSPAVGDQYNVGTEAPYNVYRWTGTKWEDQGVVSSSGVSNITETEIDSIVAS